MRDCPKWFQDELARIGGINQYGEPIFKLIWSTDNRAVIGGKWANGFVGYRTVCMTPEPCWILMVWEGAEVQGSYETWMREFRDETGLLECGGYPKYGRYRVLQRFIHIEILQQQRERYYWTLKGEPRTEVLSTLKTETYRMEPRGLILDLMLPMLMAWRKLSNAAKTKALKEREQEQIRQDMNAIKELRKSHKISRGSKLVQRKAEEIEKGMRQAMAIAARNGLGMKIEPI